MFTETKFSTSKVVGPASVLACNLLHSMLYIYFLLPANIVKGYAGFFNEVFTMSTEEQIKILKLSLVQNGGQIRVDEWLPVLQFVKDINGMPIDSKNIGNYNPYEIFDMFILIGLDVLKIKVFF